MIFDYPQGATNIYNIEKLPKKNQKRKETNEEKFFAAKENIMELILGKIDVNTLDKIKNRRNHSGPPSRKRKIIRKKKIKQSRKSGKKNNIRRKISMEEKELNDNTLKFNFNEEDKNINYIYKNSEQKNKNKNENINNNIINNETNSGMSSFSGTKKLFYNRDINSFHRNNTSNNFTHCINCVTHNNRNDYNTNKSLNNIQLSPNYQGMYAIGNKMM